MHSSVNFEESCTSLLLNLYELCVGVCAQHYPFTRSVLPITIERILFTRFLTFALHVTSAW